jgi:hypothetical protein
MDILEAKAEIGDKRRTYLKNSLSAHGGVMKRLKMLTYYLYAALFRRCMLSHEP